MGTYLSCLILEYNLLSCVSPKNYKKGVYRMHLYSVSVNKLHLYSLLTCCDNVDLSCLIFLIGCEFFFDCQMVYLKLGIMCYLIPKALSKSRTLV